MSTDDVIDPCGDAKPAAYMSGYYTGMLVGYLGKGGHGLTPEQVEAEIALGPRSSYKLVRDVAADPVDAAHFAIMARVAREQGIG